MAQAHFAAASGKMQSCLCKMILPRPFLLVIIFSLLVLQSATVLLTLVSEICAQPAEFNTPTRMTGCLSKPDNLHVHLHEACLVSLT